MAQGVVSPVMLSPALSNIKMRAAEMQRPWVPTFSSHPWPFSVLCPCSVACLFLGPRGPSAGAAEQWQQVVQFESIKESMISRQGGGSQPGRRGAGTAVGKQWGTRRAVELHPQGRVCNENCFWRGRICLLGLPVPEQLLCQLLLAFMWQSKLIWFFSLTRKVSL